MIIKIEDLPLGKNIKKVSFDIEFEDGEVKSLQNKEQLTQKEEIKFPNTPNTPVEQNATSEPLSVNQKRPENIAFDMDEEF